MSLLLSLYATDLCIVYLVLTCLILSWVDQYYYCYHSHDVVWARLTLPYHIISYHIIFHVLLFYLFCWFDLHSILFYSTLFYFISNWLDSILFYFIEFDLLYCSVLYLISMNDLCLSVRLSICLSVYLYEEVYVFSSLLFLYSFIVLFSFISLSFLMNVFLTHTHTHTDTDTQIHMNICSFLWLVHITSKVGKWRIVFEW